MLEETEKFDRERRVRSTRFAHLWSVPEGDIGCFLALAGRYNAPTGFCHKPYEITVEPQSRAHYVLHAGHAIHSHKDSRVSKAQQKTYSLREQRTKAPSILTLS